MAPTIAKFPFTAVAGQSDFKLALLLATVNPNIGGVLVSGPRGSAKSTLAKGLADILPNSTLNSTEAQHPFVTLPLGASEDMLLGTLNLQKVLDDKTVAFQPGLLAKAHGGVLYVDEVNLLSDNLVDYLLDVAASGLNIVERDGISHSHASEFILLGTMNPDEGELRPQLQDRFGLSVELSNQYSLDERINIVRLREAFDYDSHAFCASYSDKQEALRQTILAAREILAQVKCPDHCRRSIAERCHAAQVDGLRADIVWTQAAIANAALAQRELVNEQDLLAVEELVLSHRRKQNANNNSQPPSPPPFSRPPQAPSQQHPTQNNQPQKDAPAQGDWGAMDALEQQSQEITNEALALSIAAKTTPLNNSQRNNSGVKTLGFVKGKSAAGSQSLKRNSQKVSWFNSLIVNLGEWPLRKLAFKPEKSGAATLNLILLDTSGSVLANHSFAKAKGLIMQIAQQAYLKREQISIIGFGNQNVDTLLGRRRAPKTIRAFLDNITAAGGTPLQEALNKARDFQYQQLRKSPELSFNTYIVTDGRVRQTGQTEMLTGQVTVIDIEQAPVKRGIAKDLAAALQAHYLPLTG
ncbi:MAG: magnesium chelatase [Alteromonadaceae bacterium]|nr:MAG: magnesium chelatase [Alteromonadaceae bacterium]